MFDTVLIDIETGKMKPHTLEVLTLLDELWIIVDDNITQLKAWKNYIHHLKNQYNVTINLIHNKEETFSQPNILMETLALPILAATPTLNSYIN